MASSFNINSGISSLKSLISESVQSMSDLSGNAYRFAKEAEQESKSLIEKYGITPERRSQSRLDNLARIRRQLEEKETSKRDEDSRSADQVHRSREAIQAEILNHRKESRLDERAPTQLSENSMSKEDMRRLLLEKANLSAIELINQELDKIDDENLQTASGSLSHRNEVEYATATLIMKHFENEKLIKETTHQIPIKVKRFGSVVTYGPASFKPEYFMPASDYRAISSIPRDIQFDSSLSTTISVVYTKIEKKVKTPELLDLERRKKLIGPLTEADLPKSSQTTLPKLEEPVHHDVEEKEDKIEDHSPESEEVIETDDQTLTDIDISDEKPDEESVYVHSQRVDTQELTTSTRREQSLNEFDVVRRFSRLMIVLDENSGRELDRFDQDFEVSGRVTQTGFEPTLNNRLKFPNSEVQIPDGYVRSDREDEIEISLTDSYLLIQRIFVISKESLVDDVEESQVKVDLSDDAEETQTFFEERLIDVENEMIEVDDVQVISTVSRTVNLYHEKKGLHESIVQRAEFEGERDESGQIKWSETSKILPKIDLYERLKPLNLHASHDVSSMRVSPTSLSLIENILISDDVYSEQVVDCREVRYVCDDEILFAVIQKRHVNQYTNVNTGEVTVDSPDFAEIDIQEFEGYRYRSITYDGQDVEVHYIRQAETVEEVLKSLPDKPTSKLYEGDRVTETVVNPTTLTSRLQSHLRRVRSVDGQQVSNYSLVFKVLGRYVTEEAIADEIFRQLMSDYPSVSTSRVLTASVKVLGPIYSGEGMMRNVKQILYNVNVTLM